jgi:hypothetical protein
VQRYGGRQRYEGDRCGENDEDCFENEDDEPEHAASLAALVPPAAPNRGFRRTDFTIEGR